MRDWWVQRESGLCGMLAQSFSPSGALLERLQEHHLNVGLAREVVHHFAAVPAATARLHAPAVDVAG